MSKDVKEEFVRLCTRAVNIGRLSSLVTIGPMMISWSSNEGLTVTIPGPDSTAHLRVPIFTENCARHVGRSNLPMMAEFLPALRRHLVLEMLSDV